MKIKSKKIPIVIGLVGLAIFIITGSVLIAGRIQRDHDLKALHNIVARDPKLKTLIRKQAIVEGVVCTPSKNNHGRCTALQYKVSEAECLQLLSEYGINRDKCYGAKDLSQDGRALSVSFGQVYERPGTYIQVTLNEPNLLWKYW